MQRGHQKGNSIVESDDPGLESGYGVDISVPHIANMKVCLLPSFSTQASSTQAAAEHVCPRVPPSEWHKKFAFEAQKSLIGTGKSRCQLAAVSIVWLTR